MKTIEAVINVAYFEAWRAGETKKPLPEQGFIFLVAREGIEPPTLRI